MKLRWHKTKKPFAYTLLCLMLPLLLVRGVDAVGRFVYRDTLKRPVHEISDISTSLHVNGVTLNTNASGAKTLIGTMQNVAPDAEFSLYAVTFHVYDSHGKERVPVHAERETLLKPGGVWEFAIPLNDPEAASCKLERTIGVQALADHSMIPAKLRQRFDEIVTMNETKHAREIADQQSRIAVSKPNK